MSNSQKSRELKDLQREVAELRTERKRASVVTEPAGGGKTGSEVESSLSHDEKRWGVEWERTISDVTACAGSVVKEIEDAARERPLLTLLAAFSSGVVIGHLIAKRNK